MKYKQTLHHQALNKPVSSPRHNIKLKKPPSQIINHYYQSFTQLQHTKATKNNCPLNIYSQQANSSHHYKNATQSTIMLKMQKTQMNHKMKPQQHITPI
ncbi:hypothetical protein [Oceanisphaera marina]|uniref:hypothetical protein n=1 Tax=Oceanisphaera marina TaxID=2017550 RepID=UPI0016657BDA|nr:hypothetical protein [Oceanisphaera marina]